MLQIFMFHARRHLTVLACLLLFLVILAGSFLFLVSDRATQTFAKGADVSWLPQMEATGFRFLNRHGEPADPLTILKDHGIDTIRLRVFVDPSDDPRNGHCSPSEVVTMAERSRKLGFRILIAFHYSDTWADSAHQAKPTAWATHSFERLTQDVFEHTHDVLAALKVRGVMPEWVQIGNEISGGMLWPEGKSTNAKNLAELINAGYRAVKAHDGRIKVIVHLDRGSDSELHRRFFDQLSHHDARYDVIGLSYYPYWDKVDYTRNVDALGKNLIDLSKRYGKEVMVVEVGGPDTAPDNTRDMLTAVLKKVRSVPNGKGLGVIYWEPQAAASWSQYGLSCWTADGKPTVALEAFREVDRVPEKHPRLTGLSGRE